MAGPVPTYLSTQLAAQTAFTVPFGLLSLVNGAITTATAAGEFNTTVDCSLFTTEDVSNLRIYLDSQGYLVQFAKGTNEKSLLIGWGKFLDIPGTEIIVDQGTTPWIIAGTVDQGTPNTLANGWPVEITEGTNVLGTVLHPLVTTGTFTPASSSTAVVTAVTVTTSSTTLLVSNSSRKGFTVQCQTTPFYIILGSTASTSLYSAYVLKLNEYSRNDYTGPIAAVLDSGSASVLVTELV
jgi:hypothetical protein